MARLSEFYLPNPTTGAQEKHHFETELQQLEDMTSFAQTFNKKSDAASMRSHIGAAANTNATTTAAGLMTAADKVKADAVVHSAEAHNGIFRGKDLTSYFNSGQMSTDIAAGNWTNIYIGDYITKTVNLPAITYTDKAGTEKTQAAQTFANAKFYVAGINSHLKAGDAQTTANHVVLISANTLQVNVTMNPTNDTTGGYIGSDMWRVHMPNWTAAIKAAFGEGHVLKHRELLSNTLDATAASAAGGGWMGTTTNWAWTDVEVNIPNETMIYGGHPHSSSHHDVGDWAQQLPLFAHKQYIGSDDRRWFWLRAVASASLFANVVGSGNADAFGASAAYVTGGIRPYFLLK